MGVIITLCFGTLFVLFGLFNLIHYFLRRIKGDSPKKELDFSGREGFRHEFLRKIFHIILFFGIIILLVVGYELIGLLDLTSETEIILDLYWGSLDGLGMHNLRGLDFGQGVIFALFALLTTLFTMNEGARLGENWFFFPLRRLASLSIREKERDTVASYVYFSIGMMFAAMFIYPIPLFSIIGILSLADTAASLFGRRYGKHRLAFNRTKSWEGSIGGVIVCLLVTVLLVGPIWGIVATIVFFIIDAITPVLPLSDNIAIPVGVTGAYLLLSFLQVPMYSIVFSML